MTTSEILNLPESIAFSGEVVTCFLNALTYMEKANKDRGVVFLIKNYIVEITVDEAEKKYTNEYLYLDEIPDRLVAFHFIPKLTENNLIQGIPFAVSDNGMYENGLGISLVYDINKCLLLRSVYMR